MAPMGVQESYMLMQQFPMLEGGLQGAQQLLLTTAQLQRILWVHGREIHVQHGKCFPSMTTVPFSKSTPDKRTLLSISYSGWRLIMAPSTLN